MKPHALQLLKAGAALCALSLLSGCETMGGLADSLGEHMPVISDRCEAWQCFTSGGQAQSDAVNAQKEKEREMEERRAKGLPPEEPAATSAQGQQAPAAGAPQSSMSSAAQQQYMQYMQQQKEQQQQQDQSSFYAPGSNMTTMEAPQDNPPPAPAQPY